MTTIPRIIPRGETTRERVARIVECRIVRGASGPRCATHQRPDDDRPACPYVNELLRQAGAA